jgi:hypothetical protein
MTGGEQFAFVLQTDQEVFTNAPDIDVTTALPALGEPAGDWDAEIRDYWEGGGVSVTQAPAGTTQPGTAGTASPEATAMPEAASTASPEATAMPATTGTVSPEATALPGGAITPAEMQGVVLASEVLGSTISVGTGGEVEIQPQGTGTPEAATSVPAGTSTAMPEGTTTLGTGGDDQDQVTDATIDDVVVDVTSGDILYVVLMAAFSDGERWIPVPLDQFSWDAGNETFILDVNPAMYSDAPFFPDGQYPSMMTEGWDSDYSSFWQSGGSGTGGAEATATP